MTLWTPGGEVPIDRGKQRAAEEPESQPVAPGSPPRGGASAMVGGPSLDDLSPEERARAEAFIREMAEAQARIAATPAAQLVANHLVGLYELAAIKLNASPPKLSEASLAIDALAAVLTSLGSRFGEDEAPLQEMLHAVQMAFVELSDAGGDSPP